jgi:hypothetical protein
MKHLPSFHTAVCYDFKMLIAEEKHKMILINSLKFLVDNKEIIIHGYVIMRFAAREIIYTSFGKQLVINQTSNFNVVY